MVEEPWSAALDRYQAAVDALSDADADQASLLAALVRRDQLAALGSGEGITPEVVQRLAGLDERLQRAACRFPKADWETWRRSLNPGSAGWWWRLDEPHSGGAGGGEFLWTLLAGVLMTATLGLGADISGRLWGGGADGLSIVSAVLTLVLTGGPLTSQGRDLAGWLIRRLRLPVRYQAQTMLAAAGLFFGLVLLLRLAALPAWANASNNRGVRLLQAGDLTGAQQAFERAVSINPAYASAYYNLAGAYADIGDDAQARTLYIRALAADRTFDLAYNGLGYVLIRQGAPEQAIPVLYTGLGLARDAESRVALWTNLGRAYLAAGRYAEAAEALTQALALNPQEAAAHCALGLAGEKLAFPGDEVRLHWESCLSYADPITPRGQELAAQARAHLRALEEGR